MAEQRQKSSRTDPNERIRLVYGKVLNALEEALFRMRRTPAEGPDVHDNARSGMFHLGTAGGLAFSGRLPGIDSEALFDDISDAAEKRDVDRLDEIRRRVEARLKSKHSPDTPSPARATSDWEAGYLQMLAALNEACAAQEAGDDGRYSLMAGFLVGWMSTGSGSGIRNWLGSLQDAVLAAHDPNPERARSWGEEKSIMARGQPGESHDADPRAHLLQWVGERLAAVRLSAPAR